MGRHRRPDIASAATDCAAGTAGVHRFGVGRKSLSVCIGLLGALVVGAVVLHGSADKNTTESGTALRAKMRTEAPWGPPTQGDASPSVSPSASPSRSAEASKSPSKEASPKPSTTAKLSERPSKETTESPQPRKRTSAPTREETRTPQRTVVPSKPTTPTKAAAASAESAVSDIVNKERVKAGCSPLTASSALSDLARAHSKDMAARGFFGHTNPDGETPWDRADKAGVSGFAGENIARGQADAQVVMASWMTSEGHRANILNCDFMTLGVGVHIADGGPWWTLNFGS